MTLTGTGGVGKTRLAARVAATEVAGRPGGAWWVELAAVSDQAQVAELVAAALGVLVEPMQGPLRSLTAQLRDRRTLICLNNCEHVIDGAVELARALLRSCPEVSVLTTSREPLAVPGEVVWRVPSLVADEALRLFVERGRQVRQRFTLDQASEAAARVMCSRLDGIPLAIELAAAWLRTLTPKQIEHGLDERREYDELVAQLRQTLGDEFATAWAAGTQLSLDDAVAYVRRSRGARGRPAAG